MLHVYGWVCGPQRTAFGAVLASIHHAGSRDESSHQTRQQVALSADPSHQTFYKAPLISASCLTSTRIHSVRYQLPPPPRLYRQAVASCDPFYPPPSCHVTQFSIKLHSQAQENLPGCLSRAKQAQYYLQYGPCWQPCFQLEVSTA